MPESAEQRRQREGVERRASISRDEHNRRVAEKSAAEHEAQLRREARDRRIAAARDHGGKQTATAVGQVLDKAGLITAAGLVTGWRLNPSAVMLVTTSVVLVVATLAYAVIASRRMTQEGR